MRLQPKRIHVFLRDGHSPATIKPMRQSFTSPESLFQDFARVFFVGQGRSTARDSRSCCEFIFCSPPARWGLLDFMRVVLLLPPPSSSFLLLPPPSSSFLLLPPPSSSFLLLPPPSSSFLFLRVIFFFYHHLPPLPPLPRPLLPCQLLAKLFANFGAQCALLDLNLGPSQLSAHCWTSTWGLPSSVRTAGPQPGTFLAQCAALDLNLGPAELSAHRWTSAWGLPSSVRTARPQKPDRMPEDMPDRMREDLPVTKCINVIVGITRSKAIFPPL